MDELSVERSTRQERGENTPAGCWALARQCVVGLSLAIVCQASLAQTYRITPLGSLGVCTLTFLFPTVTGLNEADQVTGDACNAKGDYHAFLWSSDGTPEDLGPAEAGSSSDSHGINASGLVGGSANDSSGFFAFTSSGGGKPMKRIYSIVGDTYGINDLGELAGDAFFADVQHAFLWKNDGSLLDLGALGGDYSDGYTLSASGQVAGLAYLPGNVRFHAFVWKNDGKPMLDLGTLGGDSSMALLINASGQVVGISALSGRNHARAPDTTYFWKNDGTPIQSLGAFKGGGSLPSALNDAGQIVGFSFIDGFTADAFVWLNDGTPMKDLGSLGGNGSSANDINAAGQVTGWGFLPGNAVMHAFVWRNDGTKIKDLNKLIVPADPLRGLVTLNSGDHINNRGDIVAEGTDNRTGQYGLYLLQSTGVTISALTLTPRSLAFGNVPVNSSSAAQSVTVTNTSPTAVAITEIALRGTAPKQFSFTDNCGKSLGGHATCTLKAQFAPSVTGAKTAYLDVNGGGGGLRSVKLTGNGT